MRNIYILLALCISSVSYAQIAINETFIQSSDIDNHDMFGSAVAVTGDYAIFGAPGDRTKGSVYIFKKTNEGWEEVQKLVPADNMEGNAFGKTLAAHGNTLVVGFSGREVFANGSGSGEVYELVGDVWEHTASLHLDTGYYNDRLGYTVAVHNNTILIGSPFVSGGGNYGEVHVFKKENATWSYDATLKADVSEYGDGFASALGANDDYVFVGAYRADHTVSYGGAVYVYKEGATGWTQTQILHASPAWQGSQFGDQLAVYENDLVVGAPYCNYDSGSVYIFQLENEQWVQTQQIFAGDAEEEDHFGSSVAISCNQLIVGATYEEEGGFNHGAAYIFEKKGDTYEQIQKVFGPERSGLIGLSVAANCDHYLTGANGNFAYAYDISEVEDPSYIQEEKENLIESVLIYPNPCVNQMIIETEFDSGFEYEIFKLNGQRIEASNALGNRAVLNTSLYANGMYFLIIRKDGEQSTHRFVKD